MNNQQTQLTEEERLAVIARLVRAVQSGEINPILTEEQEALAKAEKEKNAAEKLAVSHGLKGAQRADVEEEKALLGTEVARAVDFDNDENECDMNALSPAMLAVERGES